ncbi:MAG: hypothetical protein K6U08_07045, partial [Firmicutes bacterium]|nr:hypothetical protein [Bacillota bacterium]
MEAQATVAKPRVTAESVMTAAKSRFALGLMALGLRLRPGLRDHLFDWGPDGPLGDFRAAFRFRDRAGLAQVWAVFGDGRMRVSGREPRGPGLASRAADVTVTFRDLGMMRRFFSLGNPPDLLVDMLKGDIVVEGNLSYLGRFGHLSQLAAGRQPRRSAASRKPRPSSGHGSPAAGPGAR